MACWGYRSYENALTLDRVALPAGCYEQLDTGQVRMSDDGKAWAHMMIADAAWRDPGVAVWLIEMGANVPEAHVRSALSLILQDQAEYHNAPSLPLEEERELWWRALQTDIDVLQRRLAASASPLRKRSSFIDVRERASVHTCVM
jgi:hypothetical protein